MCLFMVVHFVRGGGDICMERIQIHGEYSNENMYIYGGLEF